ncbi:MAG: Rrf2 family transcriptional regulator [Acidobacteriota bacterium]
MLSNTHFSIAVHVLTALAYHEHEEPAPVGSSMLAKTVGTNPSFLRGLIGRLRDAGLVETVLGKGGGTRLALSPSRITLHDVYRATVSQPALKTHPCSETSPCLVAAGMRSLLSDINSRLELAVAAELEQITVQNLLDSYYRCGNES